MSRRSSTSREQLLDPDLLGEMYRIPFPAPGQHRGYGLGVGVGVGQWDPGVFAYSHGGSGFGFQGILAWVPSAGLGLVVLTNSLDQLLPLTFGERVIRSLVDVPATVVEQIPPAVPVTPGDLDRFAGEYVGPDTMTLLHDGTQLWQDVAGEKNPLRVVGRDTCVQAEKPHYALTRSGVSVANLVLHDKEGASVATMGDRSRRLDYHAPGIYYLCDGEVLDLTRTPPTLANIPLRRRQPRHA